MLRCILMSLFLVPQCAASQWNTNPAVNNQLCADAPNIGQNFATDQRIQWVNDGNNGAFAAWFDQSNPSPMGGMDVKVQHISSLGVITWPSNGITVGTGDFNQRYPAIVADGTGGVIVIWIDDLTGLRAQRVDVSGNFLWGNNGVLVSNITGIHSNITRNENGDFTIIWNQNPGLYAQRIDINGNLLWNPAGAQICSGPIESAGFVKPQLINDGNNGVIIAWEDRRDGLFRIYAQKVNSAALIQWAPDGIRLRDQNSFFPRITTDGNGGVIVTWQSQIDFFNFREDIFCQRLDMSGTPVWAPEGLDLTPVSQAQTYPTIISDNNGGAIITWRDNATGNTDRIYGQRVNSSGSLLWGSDALLVTQNNAGFQKISSDGSGGVFINWTHFFTGNIYVQRLTQSGTPFFLNEGLQLTTAPASYPELINAGTGIGISVWVDQRTPGQVGIYAARFVAATPTPVRWVSFRGNRQGADNKLSWVTAYEENNDKFIIQHSVNGTNFQDIGSVNGQTSSSSEMEYHFIHRLAPSGKNFYRILQKDLDGRGTFSSIVILDEREKVLRVDPNPTEKLLNVNAKPGLGKLVIHDALGNIRFRSGTIYSHNQFDISFLPPGMYVCRYGEESVPFIKQ